MKFCKKKQFGFREKHSTYMAILDLVDNISQKIDSKNYFMSIFIDLCKTFATINQKILIDKLEYYELSEMNSKQFGPQFQMIEARMFTVCVSGLIARSCRLIGGSGDRSRWRPDCTTPPGTVEPSRGATCIRLYTA